MTTTPQRSGGGLGPLDRSEAGRRPWGRPCRTPVRLAAAVAAVIALAGCLSSPDPSAFPASDDLPDVVTPTEVASTTVTDTVPTGVRASSLERQAQEMTVRIRTTGCGALGTGSGFAIGDGVIVTNRHVVEDARDISLNTWDGGSLTAVVHGVDVTDDLALIRIDRSLATAALLAPDDPTTGAQVTVVGFPLGGQQELTRGQVVDYARLDRADGPRVIRISAEIWPGSSGGPVLDDRGRVVGVVFAIERATDYALAVPVSQVREALAEGVAEADPLRCDD